MGPWEVLERWYDADGRETAATQVLRFRDGAISLRIMPRTDGWGTALRFIELSPTAVKNLRQMLDKQSARGKDTSGTGEVRIYRKDPSGTGPINGLIRTRGKEPGR